MANQDTLTKKSKAPINMAVGLMNPSAAAVNLSMNQRISTKLAVGFCALLLFADVGFAQKKNPTVYPYSGVQDKSRQEAWMEKSPLNFNNRADFSRATIDSLANFSFAKFDDEADFFVAKFHNRADFSRAKFHNRADFSRATFDSLANFSFAKFDSVANFRLTKFGDEANFIAAKFDDEANFAGAKFDIKADFSGAKFDELANFSGAKFDSLVDFSVATFDSLADFSEATFDDLANFRLAKFDDEADFVQARFGRTVSFSNTDFRQGVDFRQAYFDLVQIFYLEKIAFPVGKFRFYWHQFQGKDSLRIKVQLRRVGSSKQEHYTRIHILYNGLRDNFLAQRDNASADAVMYELGWQRAEILKEFWWKMYGYFFGWGYKPWRFLLSVVAPIIVLFSGIWYWFYYGMLIFINPNLSPQITSENPLRQKEKYLINFKNVKIIKIRFNDFSSLKGNINRLTRYWHAILFSAGVLLGIRFKEKWAQACPDNILGRKTFIYCVTFEWLLGIGFIVTFAILVKGARFGFIRDLLGF